MVFERLSKAEKSITYISFKQKQKKGLAFYKSITLPTWRPYFNIRQLLNQFPMYNRSHTIRNPI